jgi:DNA-directed RNA polymerase subunit B
LSSAPDAHSGGRAGAPLQELTPDDYWVVFSSYIREQGLARQHLDSFNTLIEKTIHMIFREISEITPAGRKLRRQIEKGILPGIPDIKITIDRVWVDEPKVREADGKITLLSPMEARIRNITYMAPLMAEMSLYENGVLKKREVVKLGDIPVMVKSNVDPLSKMSYEELIELGEDPYDPGGYFIINGSEKVIVAQEDLAVNRIITTLAKAGTAKITHTAKIVSTYMGERRQVIVDRMSDGSLEVSMSRINARIPFYVLMMALGLERDVEIVNAVSTDPDVQRELMPSIEKVAPSIRTREEALEYIGNRVASPGQPREIRIERALEFLDENFLPHLGKRPEDRRKKAFFLAEMANRVLQLYLGKRREDDKDHYSNKRLRLAGDLIAELIRQAALSLRSSLAEKLEELIVKGQPIRSIRYLVKQNIITDKLRGAIATGNWGGDRTGISQQLDRTNWISLLSHLRRVVSPLSRGQAHFEARDLHGTHWGRLCPFETPEGVNCGLVKNLALYAYISVGVPEEEVEELLYKELGVQRLEDLLQQVVETGEVPDVMVSGAKVFLNGRPVGYHPDGEELARRIRELRRQGRLSHEVSVAHIMDEYINEVYINTDEGRLMRPVIVVENGVPRLTKEHVEKLRRGELKFWDLVKMGVIEFLDPDEEENAYIAEFPEDLTPEHTHLELWPPAILGVAASTIPYLEHNQSPRNTYQSAMAKQALGLYALNYHYRMDSHSYLLHYPQKPIVQTRALELMGYNERPAGQNMVVALMSFSGYNIEDALIFNKHSIDMGLARATFFRVYTAQENAYPGGLTDKILVPSPSLEDHKGDEYYEKLAPDGIVEPEVEVRGGDVLVGRQSPPRFMSEERVITSTLLRRRDTSVQLRHGEKGVVDAVIITQTVEKHKLVKVRVRDMRIPEIGDKFASRHGQKGVIGMIFQRYDLPYTEEGIVPDVILNPHAIPSRMTVGQLIETIAGKLGAIEARFVDGTPFYKENIDGIKLRLLKHGYHPHAREVMYDGRTGEMLEKPITIGIVFYQRLYHMVADKIHARATGKVQLLTRQPTEGRARRGGLRFGEMERDALVGHGAAMLVRDRMLENSDAYVMYVCRECGHIAWYNRARGVFECPIHGPGADVVPVKVPYAFKLLLQEIMSMAVKPEIKVADKIKIANKIAGAPFTTMLRRGLASGAPSNGGSGDGSALGDSSNGGGA